MKTGVVITLIVLAVVISASLVYSTYNSNVPKTSSIRTVMYSIQDIIKEKNNDTVNS